jgi:DNA invertase Pin-like site-specific DNA recombinase
LQRIGIERAKAAGVYEGRKKTVPVDDIRRLYIEGMSVTEIARTCNVSRMSVYRNVPTRMKPSWRKQQHERQMKGVAKAKAAGKYNGRKKSVPDAEVRKLKAQGMGVTAIADRLGISRM